MCWTKLPVRKSKEEFIMIIKVGRPDKDGKNAYKNTGSCQGYVTYLCKEDKEKDFDMELFFNHEKDDVSPGEVVKAVDRNWKSLGKNDAKFYSVILAPEDKELDHLGGDKKKLKEYSRKVMEVYAQNFNNLNGKNKGLNGSDLTYFCKLEDHRYYKGTDREVKRGLVKQGEKKPGTGHMHIHIIVARKDQENRYKLSPLVNDKKVFHIEGFKLKSGYEFEKMYNYRGSAKHLEAHMEKRAGNRKEIEQYADHKPGPVKYQILDKDYDLAADTPQATPKPYPRLGRKHAPQQEKDRSQDRGMELGLGL